MVQYRFYEYILMTNFKVSQWQRRQILVDFIDSTTRHKQEDLVSACDLHMSCQIMAQQLVEMFVSSYI